MVLSLLNLNKLMPEAPSIYLLGEKLQPFVGKKVIAAGGYGGMETDWLTGQKLLSISNHGKYLFLHFKKGIVSVHLGLFGSVLINEKKKVNAKFFLHFKEGEINAYIVNAKKLDENELEEYNPKTDILSPKFDAAFVKKLVLAEDKRQIDDILMDQEIFSGVGNKIRNEALYRSGIHPMSIGAKIPPKKMDDLIKAARAYTKIFFNNLKKKGTNKDFQVYKQEYDPDGNEVVMKVLTKTKRKIYFVEEKQKLYK